MPHPDWCGGDCASCTSNCGLNASIPCSPDCMSMDCGGNLTLDCVGCDAPLTILENKIMYFQPEDDALFWCPRHNFATSCSYCEQECSCRNSCEDYICAREYTNRTNDEEEEE